MNYNALERAWFSNEWRSACHIVKKGAKKKGVDLSKMKLVEIVGADNKKGDEEG